MGFLIFISVLLSVIVMVFVDVSWADEFESDFSRPIRDSIVVIVDTFRATTTIPVALYLGAKRLVVLKDTNKARKLKEEDPTVILAGEKGGIMLPGFDTGNSPYGLKGFLSDPSNRGRTIVLNTGNFSRVLEDIIDFVECPIIVGAPVNRQAVVDYLKENAAGVKSIYFVSTGTFYMEGERYDIPLRTLEDLFGGLTILKSLLDADVDLTLSERADHYLKEYAESIKDDESLKKALWETHYAKYLLKLDEETGNPVNQPDLEICVQINTHPLVPIIKKTNGLIECVPHK